MALLLCLVLPVGLVTSYIFKSGMVTNIILKKDTKIFNLSDDTRLNDDRECSSR
jgi:hypothetical protein